MSDIFFFIGIGVASGFLSGLLGIGGGLVAIPCLFALLGDMYMAIGTSLAAMVFTTCASAITHQLKRGIEWRIGLVLAIGIAAGASIGPVLARAIPSDGLRILFGACEVVVGLYFASGKHIRRKGHHLPPSPLLLGIAGALIGSFASMLGLGGGFITVPFLHYVGLPIQRAIGTSALMSFLVMLIGAISFFFAGGGVDVAALIPVALAALLFAPLGAHCAHIVPGSLLKRAFGIALVITGAAILISTL